MSETTTKAPAAPKASQVPSTENLQARIAELEANNKELTELLSEANAQIAALSRLSGGRKPVVNLPAKGDRPACVVVVNHGVDGLTAAQVAANLELVERLVDIRSGAVSVG